MFLSPDTSSGHVWREAWAAWSERSSFNATRPAVPQILTPSCTPGQYCIVDCVLTTSRTGRVVSL